MDTDLCKVALNDSAYRHAGLIVTDDLQINGGRIAPPRSEVFSLQNNDAITVAEVPSVDAVILFFNNDRAPFDA